MSAAADPFDPDRTMRSTLMTEPVPECPYRGLDPFSNNEHAYFFGRDVEIETVGANLITAPLTIFYGSSGVGKTSVLLAGVVPFVSEQPDVTPVVFRSWQSGDFERLLKSEIAAAVRAQGGPEIDVEQTLDRCLDQAAVVTRGTIAVIFDQFEEYMLYHAATSPAGQSFDVAFARAVNSAIDANFLIAIREDALARLDRYRTSVPDMLANCLRLDHLDASGARDAIRLPLAHYDDVVRAHGRDDLRLGIEDELVTDLINGVRIGRVTIGGQGKGAVDAPDRGTRVETPFLQMVLVKLWESERRASSRMIRKSTLTELGGAQKIVRDHVDVVMRGLSPDEREAAALVFDRLVTPSGSKIALTEQDLIDFGGGDTVVVRGLLVKLSTRDVRILRPIRPAGETENLSYEIFHDVLSAAVLAWHTRHALAARQRRNRFLWTTVVAGLLALLVAGSFEWRRAVRDRQRAMTDQHRAVVAEAAARQAQQRAAEAEAKLREGLTKVVSEGKDNVAVLNAAAETYTKLDDREGQIKTFLALGQTALLHGDRQAAIAAYGRARALGAHVSIPRDVAVIPLIAPSAIEEPKRNVFQQQVAQDVKKQLAQPKAQVEVRNDPVEASFVDPACQASTLEARWAEWDRAARKPILPAWRFTVADGGKSLRAEREDGSASGTLRFDGKQFSGSVGGAALAIPLPDASDGCVTIYAGDRMFRKAR